VFDYIATGGSVHDRVERPKFYRLAEFLSKGYFKGVIFLCWDRASRNKGDDTIVRKLMLAGIDIRFALAQYENTSAGELHMDIDGMFSAHHSRVTREKVTLTIRDARARGLVTHKAPVGYLNQGKMDHKPQAPCSSPAHLECRRACRYGRVELAGPRAVGYRAGLHHL
jgi:site-specific DNA recombinase